ncbi:MAG: hypothetical protein KI792_09125 [Alphaproteobacteria bacterium]|nr:hypothetical protein [Alphaproteobacteria bacterium SS10]
MSDGTRPAFNPGMTGDQFLGWYWEKEMLETICETLQLSRAGSKAELRHRIAARLDGQSEERPTTKPTQQTNRINWSKAALTGGEIIDDQISFGPNVRGFFKAEIGKGFTCSGEFMAWVRAHPGYSLNDAIAAWYEIEARNRAAPDQKPIAKHNNYLRYLRAFKAANPELTQDDGKRCWKAKKLRPTGPDGYVQYGDGDLAALDD